MVLRPQNALFCFIFVLFFYEKPTFCFCFADSLDWIGYDGKLEGKLYSSPLSTDSLGPVYRNDVCLVTY